MAEIVAFGAASRATRRSASTSSRSASSAASCSAAGSTRRCWRGAIPKVVFSRTLDSVRGNARLAEASLAEEAAAALGATGKDVAIGGAGIAAQAVELGLVDELRMFRYPVVVGGGTPFLPPVADAVPLDLIESTTLGSRVIYERYRRAHDEPD